MTTYFYSLNARRRLERLERQAEEETRAAVGDAPLPQESASLRNVPVTSERPPEPEGEQPGADVDSQLCLHWCPWCQLWRVSVDHEPCIPF